LAVTGALSVLTAQAAYRLFADPAQTAQFVQLGAATEANADLAIKTGFLDMERRWLLLAHRGPALFSFDHFVGATKQRQRNRQAERLRGPEIDHELELRRLMYREVGGLFAPENACGQQTSLPVGIEKVGSVACQATGIGKFTPLIDRGPTMADCEHNNLCPLVGEEWIGSDQQPSDGSLRELKNNRSNS